MNTHHTYIDPSELPPGMTDIADGKLYCEVEYDQDPDCPEDIYVSKIYVQIDDYWHELEWKDEPLIDRICQEIHGQRSDPLRETLVNIAKLARPL